MASQYGLNGGRPRCYMHMMEFQKCWKNAEEPEDCRLQHEDYFECLHRKKEIARAKTVAKHFVDRQNQEASSAKEAAEKAAAGMIISLGLVEDPTAGKGNGDGKEKEKEKQ